jgi:hypothetical protein
VLITDASHALPVRVARTGLRTIALGTGEGEELRLPYIPYSADVREGDVLVTSGMGGRFPPGLAVATIRSVKQGDVGTFAVALARPERGPRARAPGAAAARDARAARVRRRRARRVAGAARAALERRGRRTGDGEPAQ